MAPSHSALDPSAETRPNQEGISEALSYAVCNGLVVGDAADPNKVVHAPMTYFPSALPRACYNEALRITPALNQLIRKIASDIEWLKSTLADTAAADEQFTGRLLKMTRPVADDEVELQLCRYDYFTQDRALRMVEMNTVAASFACLGAKTAQLHAHLAMHPLSRPDYERKRCEPGKLPPVAREAPAALACAIGKAHKAYAQKHPFAIPLTAVMVVQPGERNIYDQDALRHTLWRDEKVELRRMTLAEIAADAALGNDGILRLKFDRACVSVVYYRAGYAPNDYPTDLEWCARETIEKSNAVKCPSAAVQLAGAKKVQQVLDADGVLERFVSDEAIAKAIRATFVRQYSLGVHDGGADNANMAVEQHDAFVLKPQREGGGNNLYGVAIKHELQRLDAKQREAYVLMERIRPTIVDNVTVRAGKLECVKVVSELGVFGALVAVERDAQPVHNAAAGTLLRSKLASAEDGGVAAGVAVLDSPRLV